MKQGISSRQAPDHDAALAQYRRRAATYDLELALFEPMRRRAIARLAPQPGETVLDVGCGTGLSFALLEQGVGPGGRIVGIEQSPEMIAHARMQVADQAWNNVTLHCAAADAAPIDGLADAALFHLTHDILQQPEAIAHVLRHLRPGARVVATGLKWAAGWRWPTNLFVLPAALRSVSSLAGLDAPWAGLLQAMPGLEVEPALLGGGYIASGRLGVAR